MNTIWYLLLWFCMPARKRPASELTGDAEDLALFGRLADVGNKTGLIDAITQLNNAGWLKNERRNMHGRRLRSRLRAAAKNHANQDTPYGPVVQHMPLPLEKLQKWDNTHPLALLCYLSTLSTAFGDLMHAVYTRGKPFNLIIYIDEIAPGNPLRPEKSRTLQAIYWALLEWPAWLLQRTAAWPVFGTIRSKLVVDLPGGVTNLMKRILCVFFATNGPSFAKGVQIVRAREDLLITARFAGLLADDKAHTELLNSKGASGTIFHTH